MIEKQKVWIILEAGRFKIEVDGAPRDEAFVRSGTHEEMLASGYVPLLAVYPTACKPPSPPHGTWAGEVHELYVEKRARDERPLVPRTDWLTGG